MDSFFIAPRLYTVMCRENVAFSVLQRTSERPFRRPPPSPRRARAAARGLWRDNSNRAADRGTHVGGASTSQRDEDRGVALKVLDREETRRRDRK
jgi:hypothetical protein